MKDEIKEILELYKDKDIEYYNLCSDLGYDKLLDYITDLQEENESLHTRIKTIKRRRKEQTAKIRKYREEITNKQNSNKDYKQRIDKVIEYLQEDLIENEYENRIDHHYIINILQGKSDE